MNIWVKTMRIVEMILKRLLSKIHLNKKDILKMIDDMDVNEDECISLWEIYEYVKDINNR